MNGSNRGYYHFKFPQGEKEREKLGETLRFQSGYLVCVVTSVAALHHVSSFPRKWPEASEAGGNPVSPDTTMAFTLIFFEA